ncbi:MAG TPA: amidohydrolase family protein [Candidatus Saccharimonadales bacterium]|nr:amidohydrolase family protein [Candidatus Saccharimonadales bacterium]
MNYDLIVRNARLRSGKVCDICISNGRIEAMVERTGNLATQIIDVQKRLVTEPFVIAHLHLDKVMTGALADVSTLDTYHGSSMTSAMTAIELASKVKEHYVESEIISRVRKVLSEAERSGVSHVRAFADVDPKANLIGVDALHKIKQEFKDRVEIDIVAFPQDGIIREPGTEELLYKAMEHGSDVIGGIPWIEYTEEEMKRHVDIAYEIAVKHDADISMLTDDAGDPDLRTTEYLASSALKNNWIGRVSACHARASALYNGVHHSKFAALLKKAEVGIVTNPHTGPLHVRVKELMNAGVTVALSQDDIWDAYYPYGRCNMLEVAFLASHLLWMMSPQDREVIYDMITINAAKILRMQNYGINVGKPANLVVLNAQDLREAFSYHQEPLHVVRNGTLVTSPNT